MDVIILCPERTEGDISAAERGAVQEIFPRPIYVFADSPTQPIGSALVVCLLTLAQVGRGEDARFEELGVPCMTFDNRLGQRSRVLSVKIFREQLACEAEEHRRLRKAAAKGLPTI